MGAFNFVIRIMIFIEGNLLSFYIKCTCKCTINRGYTTIHRNLYHRFTTVNCFPIQQYITKFK